jgi:hypothetical protein
LGVRQSFARADRKTFSCPAFFCWKSIKPADAGQEKQENIGQENPCSAISRKNVTDTPGDSPD